MQRLLLTQGANSLAIARGHSEQHREPSARPPPGSATVRQAAHPLSLQEAYGSASRRAH